MALGLSRFRNLAKMQSPDGEMIIKYLYSLFFFFFKNLIVSLSVCERERDAENLLSGAMSV